MNKTNGREVQHTKGLNKPKWVVDHFAYLNAQVRTRSTQQLSCDSELTKICEKYKNHTDKGPSGPYYIKHNYTEIYGDLLRPWRHRGRDVQILEIGVRQGGSLLMWKDFLPHAEVYGLDMNPRSVEVEFPNGVHFGVGNAYLPETAEKAFGKGIMFDVVIDDGSHAVKDQKRCLNIYSKLLNPGGLLIIEDISCIKDAKAIISAFDGRQNKCSIIDRTHCVPSLDDINVIYYDPRETF